MSANDTTPIRRQYLDLKARHPGSILFFRLGDFYETFDADAELMARELDIVLTSRPIGKDIRIPMAGVPHHAADQYIARLISRGFRVAIAEQIGSETVNGLVPREVLRTVTPGTVVEPGMLDSSRPNYLAAIFCESESAGGNHRVAGLAYCDITSGEFRCTQVAGILELDRELARISPRELIVPDGMSMPLDATVHGVATITALPAFRFDVASARQALLAHFKVVTLAGFNLEALAHATRCAGAILAYLRETQPATLALFTGVQTYAISQFMALDEVTRSNLELVDTQRQSRDRQAPPTLLGVLDQTRTPMGARMLRNWLGQPLTEVSQIIARLDRVGAFVTNAQALADYRSGCAGLPDIERLINRVISGLASPRDLIKLAAGCDQSLACHTALVASGSFDAISGADRSGAEAAGLLIHSAINPAPEGDEFICAGYSAELDGIQLAVHDSKHWVANLERLERERTGIKTLKVGFNKVFGYYLEITHAQSGMAPSNYIRKQTLANAERYITPELKEHEALILNADARTNQLELQLLRDLNVTLAEYAGHILNIAQQVARHDVAASLAFVAIRNRYCRPEFNDSRTIEIIGGRHPVIEQLLAEVPYTPNDLKIGGDHHVQVITGPNMSGKSSFMRQCALIVLMAQIGSFVPAASANLPIVDRIFTRIGAQDELNSGNSTFMVEMIETANILRHCSPASLVLLDEIGRGTSTYDGLAIAWSVIEFIHNHPDHRATTLFATHYHELIHLAGSLPGVRNFNVAVSDHDGKIVFLHKLQPGGADKSYGIHVADLAGLPSSVVNRARTLLRQLEAGQSVDQTAPAHSLSGSAQLSLFPEDHPVVTRLRSVDPNSLSPIEALTELFNLKKFAG